MAELKLVGGYPEYMRKSIEAVNNTREERRNYTPPSMTAEQRTEILSKYHPDFVPGGKRKIKIGQNKGDMAPSEVTDLLEAYPLIDPKKIKLNVDYETDILIIGSGLAGLSAAILANDCGIPKEKILLATKLRVGDSNSMMAEGGTQAADRPNDNPAIHFLDAYGGGHFTNKRDVLWGLVEDAPLVIKWLENLGTMFDKNPDGYFEEKWGGGTCRKRMHACRDYTGLEELRVVRDEFRSREIPTLEFYSAIELLTDMCEDDAHKSKGSKENKVTGAVLWNMETQEYKIVRAKATIIATGGFGRLHIRGFATTNHYGATGDGLVLAYRAGAKLRDTDTVQYHPTGAAYPQQIVGLLLTEKLRSTGAQPINKTGEAFVFPLEPRDIEASSFIRECYERDNGITTPTGMRGVWLDTPRIDQINGKGYIAKSFPGMVRMFERFGIDMIKDPVLVSPTLHYQNGGIETDPKGKTNIEGLFVAGEVSGGVHGKNRLMGNSTLDCIVYGRRSGIYAAEYVNKVAKLNTPTLKHIEKYIKMLKDAKIKEERKSPILLPDYRGKATLARMVDIF